MKKRHISAHMIPKEEPTAGFILKPHVHSSNMKYVQTYVQTQNNHTSLSDDTE